MFQQYSSCDKFGSNNWNWLRARSTFVPMTLSLHPPRGSAPPTIQRQPLVGSRPNGGWVTSVHLTESCDEDQPRLITHVETSLAGKGDVDVTPVIHQALQDKQLLPKEHLTDTNYAESKHFVASQLDYGIDLIAPTRADNKGPGKTRL